MNCGGSRPSIILKSFIIKTPKTKIVTKQMKDILVFQNTVRQAWPRLEKCS